MVETQFIEPSLQSKIALRCGGTNQPVDLIGAFPDIKDSTPHRFKKVTRLFPSRL
jgi:hypothetical protein